MPLVVKDRVKETSTTAGTGTLTLAGAAAGFQAFSVIGNGNTTYYTIVDPDTGDWEVGIGTYTSSGTTLSRDTILESSTGGTAVSFAGNSKDVFVTYPAERAAFSDAVVTSVGGTGTVNGISLSGTVTSSGNLTLGGTLSGVNLTSQVTGTLPVANGGTGQTTYTNGQLLIGNTTGNTLTKATLTAGTGISITNGTGSISIAATNNGTVTSVGGTGTVNGITLTGTVKLRQPNPRWDFVWYKPNLTGHRHTACR